MQNVYKWFVAQIASYTTQKADINEHSNVLPENKEINFG